MDESADYKQLLEQNEQLSLDIELLMAKLNEIDLLKTRIHELEARTSPI